jgi:DNA-binding XRE family transcriptional regulator
MTMPKRVLPRIDDVGAEPEGYRLRVHWTHGEESLVDVRALIEGYRVYAPLRDAPERFRAVAVGEHGTDIVWLDDIDMAADTLWRLAQEQSGATMTPDAFRDWRLRHDYTLEAAARALGLSRRTIAYYEEGKKPIPRVVALATRGLELS